MSYAQALPMIISNGNVRGFEELDIEIFACHNEEVKPYLVEFLESLDRGNKEEIL